MGVCTFFDKSMKVLSSILVGMAAAQWEGFNEYDYSDYSDVGKNQASQVNVVDVLAANAGGSSLAAGYTLPNHYLGNGLKCWFCNSRSVRDCFESATFTVCQGQEYFCFYHERRKISHFFNRREKYIDHFASGNPDTFLSRKANEAFNQNAANGPRPVSVSRTRTTQSPFVFPSMVLTGPSAPALSQPLVVMSVRVSAVWARTGLTTVDIIGSMIQRPLMTTRRQAHRVVIFSMPTKLTAISSMMSVNHGTMVCAPTDFHRSVTEARVPSQCATSAVIPLSRVNGAIVDPLMALPKPLPASHFLPVLVNGVHQPTLLLLPVLTTRLSNTPSHPLCHHGLPPHPGCPKCVTTVNGVILRPRSARTSRLLEDAKYDAFEHYYNQHLSTTVQTVTLVLTYTMSRHHHHHQTEC